MLVINYLQYNYLQTIFKNQSKTICDLVIPTTSLSTMSPLLCGKEMS